MINEDLNMNIGDGSFRDTVGFYFEKWFDEPFVVDVLNRTKYRDYKYELCSYADDRNHMDYRVITSQAVYFVDNKAYSHNYIINGKYTDSLAIGEYAIRSTTTDFISFIHSGFINIIPLYVFNNEINPLKITHSAGQNKKFQDLYMYDCYEIMNNVNNVHISIPTDMNNCYEDAYELYSHYKEVVKKVFNDKPILTQLLIDFRNSLLPIIKKFNNIYDELPKIDTVENLSDIMKLIS